MPFKTGNCVANPESVVRTMLHRFELEGNGSVSCGIHAVEDSRDVVASVDAGHQKEADLIDEIGLEKSSVDMATAFEQQRADAEVLAELIDGFGEVDRGLSGNDVGNSFLPEHGQVVSRHSLADDADKMIAVEIAARPLQLAERVHHDSIGLCAAGDKSGLRPGRRDRGGDER